MPGKLSDVELERWATLVAKILACGGIEKTQVQKLLEVVNSAKRDPFFTLEAFILYQASRVWKNKSVGKLLVEAVEWLRQREADAETLREALGYAKWIFYAYDRARHLCKGFKIYKHIDFEQLIRRVQPGSELLSVAQGLG